MDKIKLLIVDDHQIFRDGIVSLFSNVKDMEICNVAGNGHEALSILQSTPIDVVILDLSMPEMTGLELLKKLKEADKKFHILILSMHTNTDYIFNAIRMGASGYLPKEETTREELTAAIRKIYSGEEYYHESISRIMQEHFVAKAKNKQADKDFHALTKREREVLNLVVQGMSNSDIARKLFINIRTVETHKTNILQKLNLKNTVELVKFAIRNNLMDIE